MRVPAAVAFIAFALTLAPQRAEAQDTAPAPALSDGQEFDDCGGEAWCPRMVAIPAGTFVMGSPRSERGRYSNEGPQHGVSISRFAASKYEITFDQWGACVKGGGCGRNPISSFLGGGDEQPPVVDVSWNDAQEYVRWLSGATHQTYRLLSEAEWEYAARAGTTTTYPWGARASHDYANYGADSCCSGLAAGRDQWVNTSPIGSFPANAFGLYDMHGNVWEWVDDCWHNSNYNGAPTDGSAWMSGECPGRVLRGGSFDVPPRYLRSAIRGGSPPWDRKVGMGFRVARTVPAS